MDNKCNTNVVTLWIVLLLCVYDPIALSTAPFPVHNIIARFGGQYEEILH